MANGMIKMSVTKLDGTADEIELTPDQYVDMLTAVYKPQVQAAAPAPAPQPRPLTPEEKNAMLPVNPFVNPCDSEFERNKAALLSQCDGWAGNYNQPNLQTMLMPRLMNAMMPSGQMNPLQEMEIKKKMIFAGVGAGVAGLILGGLVVGFCCALKAAKSED